MSFILDALKKSDQQRQRGATPTLPTAPIAIAAPKQPIFLYYGLLTAVVLAAGIVIGWLRPWQAEQPVPATEPVAAKPLISTPHQTAVAPLAEAPEIARKTAQELPASNSIPAVQPAKPDLPAPARTEMRNAPPSASAPMPEKPADTPQEQKTVPLAELPLQVQQEIPAMTIPLHAYSSKPRDRLVSINDRMLKEGESLMPGLKLEQITPDGLIFSYKGYRFRRGVQ